MEMKLFVSLDADAKNELEKPVVGSGGFQGLFRKLQKRLSNGTIWLTSEDIVQIYNYAKKTGQGGFQGRLAPFVKIIEHFSNVWVKIFAE